MGAKRQKAIKIIKKTGRVLAWLLVALLLLAGSVYFMLRTPAAQTAITQRLAAYLAEELKTEITIKGVDIEFFKKIVLEGIYVEDQHGDTLLYAAKLKIDIGRFSYGNQYVSVDEIHLDNATCKLKKYEGERGLNYRFISTHFKSSDTTATKKSSPWQVEVGSVFLNNVTFAFIDTRDTINDPGMDYENIRVTQLSGEFTDIDPMDDSLSLRIKGLRGVERSGFTLKEFSTRLTASDTFAKFDNLVINTPDSKIGGFISFFFASTDDIADDFIHLVKMDGHFSQAILEMGDLGYFSPNLIGMRKKVLVTGDVKGTVEHLRCKNMDVRFGEKSHVAGNFSFNGLPDIEQTDMHFKIREAVTNKKDLEGIPISPYGPGDYLKVEDNIGLLGDMKFSGSLEGFIYDFVALGKLTTALGPVSVDNLAMQQASDSVPYSYHGHVRATQFNLGTFYSIPDMGVVTGNVNITGTGLSKNDINAKIDGKFSLLMYNGYPYTNISVYNGNVRRQVFDGDMEIDDPNIKMNFKGKVDNSGAMPVMEFEARIDSANLGELNFASKEHEHLLEGNIRTQLKGDNIDNMDGWVEVTNLQYRKDGENFKFNVLNLYFGNVSATNRTINLRSDIVNVTLRGQFKIMQMPDAIADVMSDYLPSYFPPDPPDPKKKKSNMLQQFKLTVSFQKNTKPLQAIVPKLEIAPGTHLNIIFNQGTGVVTGLFNTDSITYKNIEYKGVNVNLENSRFTSTMTLDGIIQRIAFSDSLNLDNIAVHAGASNDKLETTVKWDNQTQKLNDANITIITNFEGKRSLRMSVDKAEVHLNDSLWTVAPGNIVRIDSNTVSFKDVLFQSGGQSIGLNGVVSPRPADQLFISLNRFNLAYLNYFLEPQGVSLSGFVSSETMLADLHNAPVFTSNTTFDTLRINGNLLGKGELNANWMAQKEAVRIDGRFSRLIDPETKKPIDNFVFGGFYYPKKETESLDIDVRMLSVELQVLQPLLADFCSMMNGTLRGNVHIGGTLAKPLLSGTVNMFARAIRVDYLGLVIRAHEQPIYIEENSFFFDDFKIRDEFNDTCKIYGHLFHENFSNFQFDMDFNFNHFMVLNTTAADNELYYGRMFASGYMNVFGYVNNKVRIEMNVTTDKIISKGDVFLSEFNIPMSTDASETGSTDFITFVPPPSDTGRFNKQTTLKNNGIELDLKVKITPDAIVRVVFDKTVGDEITAYGAGEIRMTISSTGDFKIFGNYTVDKGKYLFTMKNVVYVPFDLAKGGTISWNGDPYEAQIDAQAVYKTTASVEPFFPMDSTNQAYHRAYPVHVVMHLTEDLMNPHVAFDIDLPTADQTIQETVDSYIATDLERNRQVLSLMVLNSFTTPSELRNSETGSSDVVGGTSATLLSNFVSGTLNNWLSQISTDFNMGVKYRPNDDLSPQELKVYLATQLLNDRIIIDVAGGTVNANQTTTGNNTQWVGDVNVEYKVTDDGRVRLRAFNRSNDNTMLGATSPYTQGVGIFYREEFESGAELAERYKRYLRSTNPNRGKKQQQDTAPKPPVVPPPQTAPPTDTTAKS